MGLFECQYCRQSTESLINHSCPLNTKPVDDENPKDKVGATKISTSVLPSVAVLHASHAMMDGARKYNAYNWRIKKVRATRYLDACERHLMAWKEREEQAQDSGVHHLGHAIACLAIILDAQTTGNLVDDRPEHGQAVLALIGHLNQAIASKEK